MRLIFHHIDSEQVRQNVLSELEHFMKNALQQIIQDGALMSDIIHMNLKVQWFGF